MNKQQILDSGLLELYVLDCLNSHEVLKVEQALKTYPGLRTEVRDIERTLYRYALIHTLPAPPSVKQNIMNELKDQKATAASSTTDIKKPEILGRILPLALSGLLAIGFSVFFLFHKNEIRDLRDQMDRNTAECDSLLNISNRSHFMMTDLASPENKLLMVNATEKFPETTLLIHHNASSKRNYLQIENLPPLAMDQSYQLWSLKDNLDPIPLDVFQGTEKIIAVSYEDNTTAYAITIESKGGNQTPDLTMLIGVIPVA